MNDKMQICFVLCCLWNYGNVYNGQAQTHFGCVSNTGDSYSIVIETATIDNHPIESGDEIAVLAPDSLCVGAVAPDSATNIPLAAWQDDPQTPGVKDGYLPGEVMSFIIWDASEDVEIAATATYSVGDGTFENGPLAVISLLEAVSTPSAVQTAPQMLPEDTALLPNYPNPFNPETTIRYQLSKDTEVKIEVFNLLGQRVSSLVDTRQPAGYYSITWDGLDGSGRALASGVYVYRLQAGDFVMVRKSMLLR